VKPKLSDVAKEAGVSPTTVSRVINNHGYLSAQNKMFLMQWKNCIISQIHWRVH
jgi:DNA-binding MurR/RpiR family transcriptional regulator